MDVARIGYRHPKLGRPSADLLHNVGPYHSFLSTPNAYHQLLPESWPLHLHLILWNHVASYGHVGLVTKQADLLSMYKEESQMQQDGPLHQLHSEGTARHVRNG